MSRTRKDSDSNKLIFHNSTVDLVLKGSLSKEACYYKLIPSEKKEEDGKYTIEKSLSICGPYEHIGDSFESKNYDGMWIIYLSDANNDNDSITIYF